MKPEDKNLQHGAGLPRDREEQVVLHWGIKEAEITRASMRSRFQTVGLGRLPVWEEGTALLSWEERSHFGAGRVTDRKMACALHCFSDI